MLGRWRKEEDEEKKSLLKSGKASLMITFEIQNLIERMVLVEMVEVVECSDLLLELANQNKAHFQQ
jgi:hypothetical protein